MNLSRERNSFASIRAICGWTWLAPRATRSQPDRTDFICNSDEQHARATWLHIRAKAVGNGHHAFSAPAFFSYKSQYWLALDGQGQPLYIARYEGLISSLGFNSTTFTVSKAAMRCEFEYKPAKDTTLRTSKRYGKKKQ
jgi:hypothetical protein